MWAEHFASKPAIGEPVTLPFGPQTRDTWIYKDDCAEQLVRLALKPTLSHFVYNNGGHCASAAEIAAIVKKFIPDARIDFDTTKPGTPLIDNQGGTRLIREIDFVPRTLEEGVRAHINEARVEAGLPPL
jgi:nucleoside-diphosphate-sugar epimerase